MLNTDQLKHEITHSPAMIYDAFDITGNLKKLCALRDQSACKVLYSIKTLPLFCILDLIKPYVDGFSVSSLFEARLAAESLRGQGGIHLTTPGVRAHEAAELGEVCSHISANSLNQYHYFSGASVSVGVRVNPELSFIADSRYDPCRPHSKLGVTLDNLVQSDVLPRIKGLHFHTVFATNYYQPLLATISKLRYLLEDKRVRLDWLNIGGGYLYSQIEENHDFITLVKELTAAYNLQVYIEPGSSIMRTAGYLLSTVVDIFASGGKQIVVLDTSVNHLPEVFEYQRPPELVEHDPDGDFNALLVGCTCLAGDVFGEYRFRKPLIIGEKIIFKNVGAYTLVKAQRFNGYNLPDIYLYKSGEYQHVKNHSYEDFRRYWLNDALLSKS